MAARDADVSRGERTLTGSQAEHGSAADQLSYDLRGSRRDLMVHLKGRSVVRRRNRERQRTTALKSLTPAIVDFDPACADGYVGVEIEVVERLHIFDGLIR